jgi:ParB-like nuclease domain
METAIATFQADKEAAFTPKRGNIKPVDIISLERRKTDEDTVTDLVEDLARDGSFLHRIAVRDEGANGYRLIAGHHRLEAWKRHFGERQPIDAVIFPSHTPDARIADECVIWRGEPG